MKISQSPAEAALVLLSRGSFEMTGNIYFTKGYINNLNIVSSD